MSKRITGSIFQVKDKAILHASREDVEILIEELQSCLDERKETSTIEFTTLRNTTDPRKLKVNIFNQNPKDLDVKWKTW